tara:strand:- start:254 stop:505 length:252 start_codon:yes stop_codon:yes gene_type:complete
MAFKMAGFSAFTKPDDKKEYEPQSKRIYVSGNYNVGDLVDEDDFEAQFKKKEGKADTFPQFSVEDFSTVKKDARGFYVTKLED